MSKVRRTYSLQEVAERAVENGSIRDALRDFLDGFYAEPKLDKLTDRPHLLSRRINDDGFADSYLAAVCDHLCRQYHFQKPEWINDPSRILKKPFFAAKTHALRMIYLQESPTAFRKRNLFVSANSISRI